MATFGSIKNPLDSFQSYGSVDAANGLPLFISNVSSTIIIAAGVYAFFNFLIAGFTYISSSGDSKKLEGVTSSINMTLIGLVVMVATAAISGIISYILFGNSGASILSPAFYGPGKYQ